jgi:hypothetical protein
MRRKRKTAWKNELLKVVFAFGGLAAIWIAHKTGAILWMTTALMAPLAHK